MKNMGFLILAGTFLSVAAQWWSSDTIPLVADTSEMRGGLLCWPCQLSSNVSNCQSCTWVPGTPPATGYWWNCAPNEVLWGCANTQSEICAAGNIGNPVECGGLKRIYTIGPGCTGAYSEIGDCSRYYSSSAQDDLGTGNCPDGCVVPGHPSGPGGPG